MSGARGQPRPRGARRTMRTSLGALGVVAVGILVLLACPCASGLQLGRLVKPFLPVLGWYAVANLPIYGIGEWTGKADGLGAMTDFSTLQNRLPPPAVANEYIVAPRGVAPRARVVDPGLAFEGTTAKELYPIIDKAIRAEGLVTPIAKDEATLRLEYVQRTPLLRFPDIITVQAVDLPGGKASSLAMHSYSIYGAGDLGTNKARVKTFLAAIEKEVAAAKAN